MFNRRKFSNLIVKLRKDLGISEKEFADKVGLRESDIEMIEVGEYSGNLNELINKIYKNIDGIDNGYFDRAKEEIKRKRKTKRKTIKCINNSDNGNNSYEKLFLGICSIDEILKFETKNFIFLENEHMTYELKNDKRTRICCYCGKEVTITQKEEDHYTYNCNCEYFLKNKDKIKEIRRKDNLLIENKLENYYGTYIKKHKGTLTKLEYDLEAIIYSFKYSKRKLDTID